MISNYAKKVILERYAEIIVNLLENLNNLELSISGMNGEELENLFLEILALNVTKQFILNYKYYLKYTDSNKKRLECLERFQEELVKMNNLPYE